MSRSTTARRTVRRSAAEDLCDPLQLGLIPAFSSASRFSPSLCRAHCSLTLSAAVYPSLSLSVSLCAALPLSAATAGAAGLLGDIRTTKPAPGHDRVLYPGLRGAEITAERKAKGIPYHPEVIVWFHRCARSAERSALAATAPSAGCCPAAADPLTCSSLQIR